LGRPLKNNIIYFSHDCQAWRNGKFEALRAHYPGERGWAMEGKFWALNCMIGEAEGCRLDIHRPIFRSDIARKINLSLEEFDEFISFLSDPEACDLLNCKDGLIWTDRCQDELDRVQKSRKWDRDRKKDNPTGNQSEKGDTGQESDRNTELSGVEKGVFRTAEQSRANSRAEQSVLEQSNSNEISLSNDSAPAPAAAVPEESAAGSAPLAAPPADAAVKSRPSEPVFSPAVLRKQLSAAGITLDKAQLQLVYQDLPSNPFEALACLAYMLRRMKEAHNIQKPVPYFLKVSALWIAEWTRDKPASEPEKSKGPISALPPSLEEGRAARDAATPEEVQALTLAAAKVSRAHHVPLSVYQAQAMHDAGEELTDRELQLIGLPPRSAPAQPPAAPLFEKEDNFEDDIPWPTEEGKKPAEEEEEMLF
jgi:hypothetical protein